MTQNVSGRQWKILFAGDVYLDQPLTGSLLSPELHSYISAHQIAVCNFEGAVRVPGAVPIAKVGPAMAQDEGAVEAIRAAGFHVVSLANNHVYDFGEAGLAATLAQCRSLVTVGAGRTWEEAYALQTVQVGVTKVGFLAFSEAQFGALVEPGTRGGYAWIGHPGVEKIVRLARARVDLLFVQCHAGVENIAIPLPEWRNRYQQLVTWGADAVIAHHPHVPQGWETFEGKPIFYSLGNFFFPKHKIGWGMTASLVFEGARLQKIEVRPIISREGRAAIAPEQMGELVRRREMLAPSHYEVLVNAEAMRLWETVYARHYRVACGGIGLATWWRDIGRAITKSRKEKQTHLLHNLQIESHLWAASRALRLMTANL